MIAHGADLPELFQNAARGLTALMVDPATVHPGGIRERIEAQAADLEALLVNWLNQVLFLFSVQQMVFSRFTVKHMEGGPSENVHRIVAEGEGELLDPGRHGVLREVKSTTFHGISINRAAEGYEARVIFDV